VANLTREQLRRFARLGAMARLAQIREEEAAIREAFPELFGRGRRTDDGRPEEGGRRRGSRMSAAQRKAVSQRMRRYWAERRKAKSAK
jgi:hypothetical protein